MYKQGKRTGLEKELRVKGGLFLQKLRVHAGLTQRELAMKLDLQYYTMVSQIENGSARIPPNLYVKYAKALNVEQQLFIQKILEYYDPYTHNAMFDKKLKLSDFIN